MEWKTAFLLISYLLTPALHSTLIIIILFFCRRIFQVISDWHKHYNTCILFVALCFKVMCWCARLCWWCANILAAVYSMSACTKRSQSPRYHLCCVESFLFSYSMACLPFKQNYNALLMWMCKCHFISFIFFHWFILYFISLLHMNHDLSSFNILYSFVFCHVEDYYV